MNRRRLLWAALAVLMAISVSSCSNEQKAPQAPERPYIPQVYTAAGLQEAVKSGGTVKLGSDVTITVPAQPEGELPTAAMEITRDTTINLNGKTLRVVQAPASKGASKISSGLGSVEDRETSSPIARISSEGEGVKSLEDMYVLEVTSGTLTISGNGRIDGSGMKGIRVGDGTEDCSAHLVINGGEVIGEYVAVHLNGGRVAADISGGKFSVEKPWNDKRYVLNKQDKFASGATYNVTGGTFESFNPHAHQADPVEGDAKLSYVNPDYYAELSGVSTYTVKQRPSGTAGYKVVWDQAGLNAICSDETKAATGILLGADIAFEKNSAVDISNNGFIKFDSWGKPVTIDLNGHKLTAKEKVLDGSSNSDGYFIGAFGSDVTIRDSSNGKGQVGEDNGYVYRAVAAVSSNSSEAKVTIEGGRFFGEMEAVFLQGKKSVGIISGGEFKTHSQFKEKYFVLNIYDADAKEVGTYFSVTGGKFINFNPADAKTDPSDSTNYVKEGYQSVKDGANDWKVVSN